MGRGSLSVSVVESQGEKHVFHLRGALDLVSEAPSYRRVLNAPPEPGRPRRLGVPRTARPYVAAALASHLHRPLLYVTATSSRAREIADAVRIWLGDASRVFLFADPEALPYERLVWSADTRRDRLAALAALSRRSGFSEAPVVVASARALMWKTLPPREMRLSVRPLRVGDAISMHDLIALLLSLGYTEASVVDSPGMFSRRGGILDVFPPHARWPVRLEFFGDEIDSMRYFDVETQRTLSDVPRPSRILLTPASEALVRHAQRAAQRLHDLDLSTCHTALAEQIREEIALLNEGGRFPLLEFYLPYFYSQPATLLDHLPRESVVLVEDGEELQSVWRDLQEQAEHVRNDLLVTRELPANVVRPYWTWEEIRIRFDRVPVWVLGQSDLDGHPLPEALLGDVFHAAPYFGGKVRHIVRSLLELSGRRERVVVVSRQADRLADMLTDAGRTIAPLAALENLPGEGGMAVVRGVLAGGFVLTPHPESGGRLHLFTDKELFGFRRVPRRVTRVRPAAPETFFSDVKVGDYVVHVDYGIGIYRGLVRRNFDGEEREYLEIEYAHGDKLFVPVYQAERLARYVGPHGTPPVLNRLGTADWDMVKRRARRAVAEMAKELLELYARRAAIRGHAFSPDSPWQQELEAAFPYEETEDQLRAAEEIKRDMEQPRPMDRLVVGDVGFGKTELAVRAAFKAVMDGKQVAVLVPTTVLAQQHYNTFRERMAPFPVNVAMLSRFLTRSQQQKVIEGLKAGSVDIVIGTHRLLSNDVEFKDLGLLIIDEEQRFGVVHKEKLKRLRTSVDVLTLTATPIPRTLHMSLTGIRDMSTMTTPPEERLPVKTTVAEYDEHLIRQAILRELDRGGQVYFVHNRVQGIAIVANQIRRIVPEARVAVAHGQMSERELERTMLAFARGEIDVLVSTTIIESGLDIPTANTIIINRADQFGLAQLYQLRGRVGRGAVRAYAYLLYDKGKRLSPEARRRLQAIYEASDLGAGFRIAMQDLELRGAGELLGARQHGHIAAVGFDLYARLLAKAVQELRERGEFDLPATGETPDPLPAAVHLDLPVRAGFPTAYVPDEELRLQLYRRVAAITDLDALTAMEQELVDRFGPMPEEAEDLLFVVRIKILAREARVDRIGREGDRLALHRSDLDRPDWRTLERRLPEGCRVGRRRVYIPIDAHWRSRLERVLEGLRRW